MYVKKTGCATSTTRRVQFGIHNTETYIHIHTCTRTPSTIEIALHICVVYIYIIFYDLRFLFFFLNSFANLHIHSYTLSHRHTCTIQRALLVKKCDMNFIFSHVYFHKTGEKMQKKNIYMKKKVGNN